MAFCVVCKEVCNDVDVIKCSDGCDSVIHLSCTNSDKEGKMKTRYGKKEWKCGECRKKSGGSVNSDPSQASFISKTFLVNVMEGLKKEVFEELKLFRSDMSDLTKSVQFVSDKLDATNTMMEEIKKQFGELKKENEDLRGKNAQLTEEVVELRERMRNLEQYSRKNNIEVSGVPSTPRESVPDLVRDIGTALGVPTQSTDVAAAHRVPSFKRDREPSLIIQFTSRATRDDWLKRYRERKELTAREINGNFPARRVYINSHLSPENKQFLAKLKQKCREVGYSFAWCRDDKFFARKSPGENAIKINTYADIAKLK